MRSTYSPTTAKLTQEEMEKLWDGRIVSPGNIPDYRTHGRHSPEYHVVKRTPSPTNSGSPPLEDRKYVYASSILRPPSRSGVSSRESPKSTFEASFEATTSTPYGDKDAEILQRILVRETMLSELHNTTRTDDLNVSLARDLVSAIRHLSLDIALKIGDWQQERDYTEAFLYNGTSYLLKLHEDLSFLDGFPSLSQALGCSAVSNPFCLRRIDGRGLRDGGAIDAQESQIDTAELTKFLRAEAIISRELETTDRAFLQTRSLAVLPTTLRAAVLEERPRTADGDTGDAADTKLVAGSKKKKKTPASIKQKKTRIKSLLVEMEELKEDYARIQEQIVLLESERNLTMTRRNALETRRKEALEFRKESQASKLALDVRQSHYPPPPLLTSCL